MATFLRFITLLLILRYRMLHVRTEQLYLETKSSPQFARILLL